MKVRALLFSALAIATIITCGSGNAFAQGGTAPNGQFGIGVNTQGGSLQYAITPSIIAGFQMNLSAYSANGNSTTTYGLGPFVRFLLEGTVNPFVEAGFLFGGSGGTSNSSLYGGFGLEYFVSRNVGIVTEAIVINIGLSPSSTQFGFEGAKAGLEWYFNR